MTRLSPFLHRVPPIPWLLMTLAASGLGLALALGFLDQYSCGLTVPADAPLPWWIYTAMFVVMCAGRASVWLPMLACAPLLRLPRRISAQVAVFACLFLGLATVFSLGHGYDWFSRHGGSLLKEALSNAAFGALYSFWITLATAAVAFGTHKFTQRRA